MKISKYCSLHEGIDVAENAPQPQSTIVTITTEFDERDVHNSNKETKYNEI